MHKKALSGQLKLANLALFPLGNSSASEHNVPTFRNTLFYLHRSCSQDLWTGNRQCVPKRRHIKIQIPGNNRKKEGNIRNTTKV